MTQLLELAKQGVCNLVHNCAAVAAGDKVVLVNELGKVQNEFVTLISETVNEEGALCNLIWIEASASDPYTGQPRELSLSATETEAIFSADKVITSVREDLFSKYLPHKGKVPLLISNLFCTIEDASSEHARYHWGMARAIYDLIEKEILQVGRKWRINTPSGTDLSGIIDDASSRASYLDEQRSEFRRAFHSGAYCPAASGEAEGVIVCEYTGGATRSPCYDPPMIFVKKNKITGIEGGRHLRRWVELYRNDLDQKVKRFGERARIVDSWHGGANPGAECIPGIIGNGGTRMMHFHLGRTTGKSGDYIAAEISNYTLEVNGKKIYENGKLSVLDHPKIKSAAERHHLEGWK